MLIRYMAPNIRAIHKKYCTGHSLLAARVTWHREYYIPKIYHTNATRRVESMREAAEIRLGEI
jgi:hypothetical protein